MVEVDGRVVVVGRRVVEVVAGAAVVVVLDTGATVVEVSAGAADEVEVSAGAADEVEVSVDEEEAGEGATVDADADGSTWTTRAAAVEAVIGSASTDAEVDDVCPAATTEADGPAATPGSGLEHALRARPTRAVPAATRHRMWAIYPIPRRSARLHPDCSSQIRSKYRRFSQSVTAVLAASISVRLWAR